MSNAVTETVHGFVHPDFEPVRAAFIENFTARDELGGAVCVYRDGENVVDLWGGVRNEKTGEPWEEDTMVLVFSLTKGMTAMTMALAHSRGWLDFDARIADYWPEFARNGKDTITVRHLLAHQAGLHAFHQTVNRRVIEDPAKLAAIMEEETPAWPPGSRYSYHVLSLGFYEAELLRRVDPQHRTLGQVFQDEIATPLGIDFYIRLPEDVPNSRLAVLKQSSIFKALSGLPYKMTLALMSPKSALFRAYVVNPGIGVPFDKETIYARNLEVPSGGGVGTARAIARAYGDFATGGKGLGIGADTLAQLQAPPVSPELGRYDVCVKGNVDFALGFMKPSENFSFGHEGAYGAPGAGGSLGFADPARGIGYGYVTNRIGPGVDPDPRDIALRAAIDAVTG